MKRHAITVILATLSFALPSLSRAQASSQLDAASIHDGALWADGGVSGPRLAAPVAGRESSLSSALKPSQGFKLPGGKEPRGGLQKASWTFDMPRKGAFGRALAWGGVITLAPAMWFAEFPIPLINFVLAAAAFVALLPLGLVAAGCGAIYGAIAD